MADPFNPVTSGDPIPTDKVVWNAMIAAGLAHRQPQRPDAVTSRRTVNGRVEQLALNSTGADLSFGKPVTVTAAGGYDLTEDAQALSWLRSGLLTLGEPASSADWVCVTTQPIPNGKIGWVAVSGVCLCDVDSAAGVSWASPQAGDTAALLGGATGTVRVLHVPDGEGSQRRCVVYLHEQTADGGKIQTRNAGESTWKDTRKLQADTASGFEIAQGETGEGGSPPGYDVAALLAAGLTQTGAVTTTAQQFSGLKGFRDGVVVGVGTPSAGDPLPSDLFPENTVRLYTQYAGSGLGLVATGTMEVIDFPNTGGRSSAKVTSSISTGAATYAGAIAKTRLESAAKFPTLGQGQRAQIDIEANSGNVNTCGFSVISAYMFANVQNGDESDVFGSFQASLFARPTSEGGDDPSLIEVGIESRFDEYGAKFCRSTSPDGTYRIWGGEFDGLFRAPWESQLADIVVGPCKRFGVKRGTPGGELRVMGIDLDMPAGSRPIVRGGLVVGYIDGSGNYIYPRSSHWASGACLPVTVPPGSPPVPVPPPPPPPPPGSPPPPPPPPPEPETATISGTVARELADGGGPLVGREVVLLTTGDSTTTDAAGGYTFAGVYGGGTRSVQLTLTGSEIASHSVDGGALTPGNVGSVILSASTHDIDFHVAGAAPDPEATVGVTVLNAVGSAPLAGRTVTIAGTSQTTNGSGQTTFTGVAVGSTNVALTISGGESASWAVDSPSASGKGATATFTSVDAATHGVTFQVSGVPDPSPGGGE